MLTSFSPFYEEPRRAEELWRIGNYQIVRCLDSRLVYLSNPLSDEELAAFYSVDYFEGDPSKRGYSSYEADEDVLRKNFRDLLARVEAEVPGAREKSLLDYGCAYGYFLDEARSRFQSVQGIELAESVAAIGRERFGLKIASGGDVDGALSPSSVEVITLWDVIEHLKRPRSVIQQCARALKPGGRIFLTTGDVDSPLAKALGPRWRLVNPPQHITYFSQETLGRLLEDCGFRVDRVERAGKYVSLGFFTFILKYMLGLRAEPLPMRWIAKKSFYVNLFDVMFMSATRK